MAGIFAEQIVGSCPTGLQQSFAIVGCVTNEKNKDSSNQCCIKDGSRPTAYAVQTEYANQLKVLCSKGMVLNVQSKGVCKGIRCV